MWRWDETMGNTLTSSITPSSSVLRAPAADALSPSRLARGERVHAQSTVRASLSSVSAS